MTNIAFTSLLFLLLALPGYIFLACYFAHEFTRQVLQRTWTDDLAKAIIFSLPFHIVGVLIVIWLQHAHVIHHALNTESVFRMLAGEFSNTGSDYNIRFSEVLDHFYQSKSHLLIYYVLILSAAFGFGHLFRWIVWEFELDVHCPKIFAFRNDWIYSILGRGQLEGVPSKYIIVWVDALTDEPTEEAGKTRLYRGLVAAFTTDEKGALRDLIITAARRSKFRKVDGKPTFSWQRIEPGDYFLIRYSEIKNLNITYRDARDPLLSSEEKDTPSAGSASAPAFETSAPTDQTSPAS
ncbi:MAG: hypothetical protein AABZ34_16220 [Nitrospirota bacterium]